MFAFALPSTPPYLALEGGVCVLQLGDLLVALGQLGLQLGVLRDEGALFPGEVFDLVLVFLHSRFQVRLLSS